MTVTATDIIIRLSDLANTPPRKTRGKIGSQKSAFTLLFEIDGGVGFIACRSATELEELGGRRICSPNLSAILREMASVELQWREKLRELAGLELERQRLIRQATEPSESDRRSRAGGPTQ
jgi:hypothetical protein